MSKFKSDFMNIMKERGFFFQCTDEQGLDKLFSEQPVTAYIGFDCTAPSLHVGSLMQIMVLRWLQTTGNNPIVLLGGATTKIGDPSGKDEARPPLSDETIAKNLAGIKSVFDRFGINKAQFVNNNDWISKMSVMELLQLGKYFSVNRMLSFDSVKLRLEREQFLSLTEFLYMVMQAYDFVELNKKYGCRLQIGGSDQWGNIVNGIELDRRMDISASLPKAYKEKRNRSEPAVIDLGEYDDSMSAAQKQDIEMKALMNDKDIKNNISPSLFGLTTPLITTSSGAKMGKTAAGAVWLDENMLSPYDYWQFWRNTSDADVGRFLRLFTELPIDEIEKLEKLKDAEINEAKIVLANEATKMCHGAAAAKDAEATAKKTFTEGGIGENLPTIEISRSRIEAGVDYISLFVEAGLADSKGAAKRLIQGGGAKKNGEKIESLDLVTKSSDIDNSSAIKLSAGKKNHAIVKVI